MRVLAVGAHPDDLEILCAGTLAKFAERGDHVTMAVATNGEAGSSTLGKAEIAAIRHDDIRELVRVHVRGNDLGHETACRPLGRFCKVPRAIAKQNGKPVGVRRVGTGECVG